MLHARWFLVLLLLAPLAACPPAVDDDDSAADDDAADDDDSAPPTWNNGIADLLDARCSGCHDWTDDYQRVVNLIYNGVFGERVSNGHQISGEAQALVLEWIDNGFPEE